MQKKFCKQKDEKQIAKSLEKWLSKMKKINFMNAWGQKDDTFW